MVSGVGWTAGFNRRLLIDDDNLLIQRGAGWQDPFTRQDGVWNGDTTTDFILVENADGFKLQLPSGDSEQYGASGLLLSETNAVGTNDGLPI